MQLPDRRTMLLSTVVITVAALGVLGYSRFRTDDESSPVPTVPVANTQANIGCIDEAGTVAASLDEWYSNEADGSLVLTGEISSSIGLGAFSSAATKAVVANIGSFATSAVRDLAPTQTACVTMRYAGFELQDGTAVEVMAWRVVARASPMWVPNEAAFVPFDETTLASDGEHVKHALAMAPDGSTVLVSAFGAGARQLLAGSSEQAVGSPSVSVQQLAIISAQVLAEVIQR